MINLSLPAFFRALRAWVLAAGLPALASAAVVAFDIPAQPAGDALMAFSRQSGIDVLFPAQELKAVTSRPVVGEFEPAAALRRLLEGTGFTAEPDATGKFVVFRAPAPAGSVTGSILDASTGKAVAGAQVGVEGLGGGTVTDRTGRFHLAKVAAGTRSLIVIAEGFVQTRVTEVDVHDGEDTVLKTIGLPLRKEGVTKLEDYVVSADKDVQRLDPYAVEGRREKPFSSANLDLPRTINDVQPYYIFDAATIETSGATNIESLLKQRLSMNTNAQSIGQGYGSTFGQTSSINLRGLGLDGTLILVNGRERAGVSRQLASGQTDLNGIPLEAIERIEVLPSSASAIYGAGALGGVVNVILKSHYDGGAVTAGYENTFSADTPLRSVGLNYGLGLEGGRTQLSFTARYSDGQPLYVGDRRELIERGLRLIRQNQPSNLYSSFSPFVGGATSNIALYASSYTPPGGTTYVNPVTTSLQLKDGTSLNSLITHVPYGAAPGASLGAQLVANAGAYNTDLGPNVSRYGLSNTIGWAPPRLRSFMGSVSRRMTPWLESYADFSYEGNHATTTYAPLGSYRMAGDNPNNPFRQNISITLPSAFSASEVNDTVTRTLNAGLRFTLPADWQAVLDYTWSENTMALDYFDLDSTAIEQALANGTLNPFVDPTRYPLALEAYRAPARYDFSTGIRDLSLRGSGPLPEILGLTPRLTTGLQHKESRLGEGRATISYPVNLAQSVIGTYFSQKATADAAFAELSLPVVSAGKGRPGLRELEFQAAVRADSFTVDVGMSSSQFYPNLPAPYNITYYPLMSSTPDYTRTKAKFDSLNPTFGVKYKPFDSLTLRSSYAKAFVPPTYSNLQPTPGTALYPVYDPVLDQEYDVAFILGGNPNLKPKTSRSLSFGAIYEPVEVPALRGLRLNLEYYEIRQFGVITAPTDAEVFAYFPSRVTRDPVTNRITLIDETLINGYEYRTNGVDLSVGYRRDTPAGTFDFNATGTCILHERRQTVADGPFVEYAGYVNEGGPAKRKANATLSWRRGNVTLGWSTTYYGSYYQYGVAGGPNSRINGYVSTYYTGAQGSDTIPSQVYHDVFASYAFPNRVRAADAPAQRLGARFLSGLTLQAGVKNVFDALPPFDAYRAPYYVSSYGDTRLRSYWVSVKKAF